MIIPDKSRYVFYWSPSGDMIGCVTETSKRRAKAWFKSEYPDYARYMGEVYIVECLAVEVVR